MHKVHISACFLVTSGVKRKIKAKPPPAVGLLKLLPSVRVDREDEDPDFVMPGDNVSSCSKKKPGKLQYF